LRLHTAEHEPPSPRRILGLTLWAASVIFIGLIPAGHLVVSAAFQSFISPWYPVTAVSLGILGLILITSAFASIHRARLPWSLMTIATSLLAANVAMVYLLPS
jgi:uncharacterized membrane protein